MYLTIIQEMQFFSFGLSLAAEVGETVVYFESF